MYDSELLEIGGVRLETRRLGPMPESAPTLVFLHEGLGSVSTWRDSPIQLPSPRPFKHLGPVAL